MNRIDLLKRYGITELTPGEKAELTRELSAAYHMDEAAASSRDVQRIAEKNRQKNCWQSGSESYAREG